MRVRFGTAVLALIMLCAAAGGGQLLGAGSFFTRALSHASRLDAAVGGADVLGLFFTLHVASACL